MKTITTKKLHEKLKSNDIHLVEVLEEEKFKKEHIKGAINIPLNRIATESKEKFNKEDEIVVYCSDEDCTASPTAAKKLDKQGFKNVFDFEGGKKAWKEAGLPMES